MKIVTLFQFLYCLIFSTISYIEKDKESAILYLVLFIAVNQVCKQFYKEGK